MTRAVTKSVSVINYDVYLACIRAMSAFGVIADIGGAGAKTICCPVQTRPAA